MARRRKNCERTGEESQRRRPKASGDAGLILMVCGLSSSLWLAGSASATNCQSVCSESPRLPVAARPHSARTAGGRYLAIRLFVPNSDSDCCFHLRKVNLLCPAFDPDNSRVLGNAYPTSLGTGMNCFATRDVPSQLFSFNNFQLFVFSLLINACVS